MIKDVLGIGLKEYWAGNRDANFFIHNQFGEADEMPITYFFEGEDEMSDLEYVALETCKGRVLDVGAGAGRFAVELQNRDCEVVALDTSPGAVDVMKKRGVKNAQVANIFEYEDEKFDTILLMMNGIGLAQTLEQVSTLLEKLKTLLDDSGEILFDSSDVTYLYDDQPKPKDHYYGEIDFRYQFQSLKGEWFKWVYVDFATMQEIADKAGFYCDLLMTDEQDQYLASLTLKPDA
ncbi:MULTISPECIES: class I SAM-dependent methyltransferase [Persicobacter]|uniref:SAM-dependent methyltransferase n=1 Tax=Persicobacter diffluens TaxID=981 RepID=A0AAN4VY83_9BACT|nr:class I SAM-dependent methyltransferase [Persicobacter sp. CCB-QB2]GJM61444.1 SAM-dependent methyltransferase [Persicobacter diffluens]